MYLNMYLTNAGIFISRSIHVKLIQTELPADLCGRVRLRLLDFPAGAEPVQRGTDHSPNTRTCLVSGSSKRRSWESGHEQCSCGFGEILCASGPEPTSREKLFLEQSASLFYWGLAAPELYSWCERRNISCNGSDHRASKLTPGSPRLVLKATGSSGKLGALTPRTRFSGGESCFFRGELLANSGGCILSYGRTCRTGMCGRSYMPASL